MKINVIDYVLGPIGRAKKEAILADHEDSDVVIVITRTGYSHVLKAPNGSWPQIRHSQMKYDNVKATDG